MFFKIKRHSIQKDLFSNKAVSDGAISFYVDHFVRTRVSKFTYGCMSGKRYDPSNPDHRSRSHSVRTDFDGEERLRNFFTIILPKVSGLISFLESMLLKKLFIFRIPKFRRRRNSDSLVAGIQILQAIYELLEVMFGVTVETSYLRSGKTLIPVSTISQLYV